MFKRIASTEDLWPGEKKGFFVDGLRLLLIRVAEDRVYAYEDRCAHKAVPLSRGRIEGNELVCSAHEWRYDLSTGEGVNPKGVCLKAYPVKIEGESIFVDLEKKP